MGKKIEITSYFEVFEKIEDLDSKWQLLVKKAKEAGNKAHAPYSEFLVGAAVLLDDGNIVIGSNQENAAYPSGLCAERVTLFAASSQFPQNKIERLAVVARKSTSDSYTSASPCGSCRQVISEYETKNNHPILILMVGPEGRFILCQGIDNLLPLKFSSKDFL